MLNLVQKFHIDSIEFPEFLEEATEDSNPDVALLDLDASLDYRVVGKIYEEVTYSIRSKAIEVDVVRPGDWDYSVGDSEEAEANVQDLIKFFGLEGRLRTRQFLLPFEEMNRYMFRQCLKTMKRNPISGIPVFVGDFTQNEELLNYMMRCDNSQFGFGTVDGIAGSGVLASSSFTQKWYYHEASKDKFENPATEFEELVDLMKVNQVNLYVEGSDTVDGFKANRELVEGL